MAILDIFKKKTAVPVKKEKPKKVKEIKPEKKIVKEEGLKIKKAIKIGEGYKILRNPHVAEKASDLAEKNQYTFRVFGRANKTEVKKAIENAYGVEIVSVKIINVSAKERRIGKTKGMKPGYKKAIAKVKKGQKIELLPR
ncbi:MAG TPA: 50S ribosomal protein L23 [Candidatus Paceibacterota bacterium]|nr:50S ribosomal protein L23 [Candidatus Paceibacterota bacterium]